MIPMAHLLQEAFELAKNSGQVKIYAHALETTINGQQQQQHRRASIASNNVTTAATQQQQQESAHGHFAQLAEHFRSAGDALNAGKFFGLAKQFETVRKERRMMD